MVPIDFEPGVEEAISAAAPLERYAAFVAFEHARYVAHAAVRQEQPATASLMATEAHRLANDEPLRVGRLAAGCLLRMGLGPAG